MKFDIITIFPDIFISYFGESILKRAQKNKLIEIETHDLRKWTNDKHKTVDDTPYGGGPGMILKVEPVYKSVRFVKTKAKDSKTRIVLFSAKGKQFTQEDAVRLSKYDRLIMICGRYEGVDERVAKHIADEEISIGNYVLTGGEIPAMILVDAISRLIPGVLGNEESAKDESFSKKDTSQKSQASYLEHPQYTKPENFQGWIVPAVLRSGNHKKIEEWKNKHSVKY